MTFSNPSPTLFEGLGTCGAGGDYVWTHLQSPWITVLYCPGIWSASTSFVKSIFIFEYTRDWTSRHTSLHLPWLRLHVLYSSVSWPRPPAFHAGNMQRRRDGNEKEDPWFFRYQYRKKQSQSKTKRQNSRLHLLGTLIHCKYRLETGGTLAFWNFKLQLTIPLAGGAMEIWDSSLWWAK